MRTVVVVILAVAEILIGLNLHIPDGFPVKTFTTVAMIVAVRKIPRTVANK